MDERECYLFITGQMDWAIPIRPSLAPRARQFAAWLNTAARERAEFEARFAEAEAEGRAVAWLLRIVLGLACTGPVCADAPRTRGMAGDQSLAGPPSEDDVAK